MPATRPRAGSSSSSPPPSATRTPACHTTGRFAIFSSGAIGTKLYDRTGDEITLERWNGFVVQILAHTAIADQASKIQLTLPAFTPLQDARNGGYPAFG